MCLRHQGGRGLAKQKLVRKKKKARFEVDAEVLLKDDMFMSVDDFQQRRVVLPFLEDDDYYEDEEEDEDDDEEDDDEEYEEGGNRSIASDEEETQDFCGRDCYVFNPKFPDSMNDDCCVHCKMFLTIQCPHLDDFMDEVDGLDPD